MGSPLLDETRAILITCMTLYTARLRNYLRRYQASGRLDVLELLRIVEALEGDARAIFTDIITRRAAKPGKGR